MFIATDHRQERLQTAPHRRKIRLADQGLTQFPRLFQHRFTLKARWHDQWDYSTDRSNPTARSPGTHATRPKRRSDPIGRWFWLVLRLLRPAGGLAPAGTGLRVEASRPEASRDYARAKDAKDDCTWPYSSYTHPASSWPLKGPTVKVMAIGMAKVKNQVECDEPNPVNWYACPNHTN